MRFTFHLPADQDDRFGPAAFDHMVGARIPLTVLGREVTTGLVVAVAVAGDGRSADVTVDLDTVDAGPEVLLG